MVSSNILLGKLQCNVMLNFFFSHTEETMHEIISLQEMKLKDSMSQLISSKVTKSHSMYDMCAELIKTGGRPVTPMKY